MEEEYDDEEEKIRKLLEEIDKIEFISLEEIQRQQKAFYTVLLNELSQVCIDYIPEVEPYREIWEKQMAKDIEFYGESLLHSIETAFSEDKIPPDFHVDFHKILTEEEIRAEIDNELAKFDKVHHKMVEDSFQELYDDQNYFNQFLFLIHKKIKEVFFRFYPQIIDFSSKQFRYLDQVSYLYAYEFHNGFKFVAGDYIDKLKY